MRRILALIILALTLCQPALAAAAGTSVITKTKIASEDSSREWVILTVVWTANASAAFDDVTLNAATYELEGYQLVAIETTPGKVAPTNGYTTNIKDTLAVTVGTNTGSATVGVISAGSYMIPVWGNLTFNIAGNSVNSATATCLLFFARRVYPLS